MDDPNAIKHIKTKNHIENISEQSMDCKLQNTTITIKHVTNFRPGVR